MCYPLIALANISRYSDVTVVLISGIVGIVNFQMRGCHGCLCLPRCDRFPGLHMIVVQVVIHGKCCNPATVMLEMLLGMLVSFVS